MVHDGKVCHVVHDGQVRPAWLKGLLRGQWRKVLFMSERFVISPWRNGLSIGPLKQRQATFETSHDGNRIPGHHSHFSTSFLHSSLFSTALGDLANSRPFHSLMLSSHLFLCLPCLLPPFTVPRKMVLTTLNERETSSYYFSLRLFTMVRSSRGPTVCWILAETSSLVTWSLYQMRSILR